MNPPKPVIPRELANRDAEEALAHYLSEGAIQAANGFIDALEKAYGQIGQNPRIGSPRWAHELAIPQLRSWALTSYPQLIFYIERDDHIDVIRVLHGHRDIPVWLQSEKEG